MAREEAGIDPGVLADTVGRALAGGGDFAEVFAEESRSLSLRMEDGRIESVSGGTDRGVSIRVVEGDTTYFGYTESLDPEAFGSLAERLSRGVAAGETEVFRLERVDSEGTHPIERAPSSVSAGTKAGTVALADEAARTVSSEVVQAQIGYSDSERRIWVANSEGTLAEDARTRVFLAVTAIARRDGLLQTGRETLAHHGGYELLGSEAVLQAARSAAHKAVVMLDARPSPAERMPVILANGFGGVILHEACGHGLESDFVAKGTSVWGDLLGRQVAPTFVTAYDDGFSTGLWGSNAFDDEGMPTQRTKIIEDGVLTSFLTDRRGALRLGLPRTGNGRRQSFRYIPYPRMTNTYFAPGSATREDVIADTEWGLYAKSLAGGQVDPATGDFVFGVSEGYLIEDGKVGVPVRGATLVGNGREVLRAVDGIADDLDIHPGTCGKEGQGVPVGSGQPTIRLRELTVGGTGLAAGEAGR